MASFSPTTVLLNRVLYCPTTSGILLNDNCGEAEVILLWGSFQRSSECTSPPGTSRESFSYPGDWRDSSPSGPQAPWTGGTQPFRASRHPEDWQDSVLSGPEVP